MAGVAAVAGPGRQGRSAGAELEAAAARSHQGPCADRRTSGSWALMRSKRTAKTAQLRCVCEDSNLICEESLC